MPPESDSKYAKIAFTAGTLSSIGSPLEPSFYLTVSEIFNGECEAMVDMTLKDL